MKEGKYTENSAVPANLVYYRVMHAMIQILQTYSQSVQILNYRIN